MIIHKTSYATFVYLRNKKKNGPIGLLNRIPYFNVIFYTQMGLLLKEIISFNIIPDCISWSHVWAIFVLPPVAPNKKDTRQT